MWAGHVKTAIGSLRASRWRTNLTMLGIIIGISSVVTIVSLGQGLKQEILGQTGRLGGDVVTIRSGKLVSDSKLNLLALLNTSTLSDQDVATLAHLPSVQNVAPVNFVSSSAVSNESRLDNLSVIGTDESLFNIFSLKTDQGEFFTSGERDQRGVVIGPDVAQKLFSELNPIGHTLKVAGQDFIVRGVLAPSNNGLLAVTQTDFNSAVLMPYSSSAQITNGKTNLLQILARRKSSASTDQMIKDITTVLQKNHDGADDFTVLKQQQLLDLINRTISHATAFITGIAAISLLVGGIGIMDILLASVSERTREIGIRKAVGATNRQILSQFFFEGLVLSTGGGILGVGFGLLVVTALRFYTSLKPVFNVPIILLAFGICLLIGVIFSTAPAIKAARKNPIDALRA